MNKGSVTKIIATLLVVATAYFFIADYMDCNHKGGIYVRGLFSMECIVND